MSNYTKIYDAKRRQGQSPEKALASTLSSIVVLGNMDDVRDLHNHYMTDCFAEYEEVLKELEEMVDERNQTTESKAG